MDRTRLLRLIIVIGLVGAVAVGILVFGGGQERTDLSGEPDWHETEAARLDIPISRLLSHIRTGSRDPNAEYDATEMRDTPVEAIVTGQHLLIRVKPETWIDFEKAMIRENRETLSSGDSGKDREDATGDDGSTEKPASKEKREAALETLREKGFGILAARLPYFYDDAILEIVEENAAELTIVESPRRDRTWQDWLFNLLPILIILLLVGFFIWRGMGRSLGLGSAHDVIDHAKLTETLDDVAGIDKANAEIQEIISCMKDPSRVGKLGARLPKGVLLSGPPGTGKTLLARAMAKEAGLSFMTIHAAGTNQIFVGAGAMKLKSAFREARKNAPCIIFIDEIDAMGKKRSAGSMSGDSEKENTLNHLLTELDGFDPREGILLVAATNRPEILDPALTRRGRIDRSIRLPMPSLKDRISILKVHTRKLPLEDDVCLDRIAGSTFGFNGADLAALANEAALGAGRRGAETVAMEDFAAARDRILIGTSGAQYELDDEEKRLTAWHEAGHALIAAVQEETDPIEKVTILPQGGALGFVLQRPERDRVYETESRLLAQMRVAAGGRAAEEICFPGGGRTTGAASDITKITEIATRMVMSWGMSEDGAPVDRERLAAAGVGDPDRGETAREIRRIASSALDWAKQVITENRETLDEIGNLLLEKETVDAQEIHDIVNRTVNQIPARKGAVDKTDDITGGITNTRETEKQEGARS